MSPSPADLALKAAIAISGEAEWRCECCGAEVPHPLAHEAYQLDSAGYRHRVECGPVTNPLAKAIEPFIRSAAQQARDAALEEAAQLALDMREGAHGTLRGADGCAFTIATAIRALKEKP